jgi:hypothetical protein
VKVVLLPLVLFLAFVYVVAVCTLTIFRALGLLVVAALDR